MLRQFGTYVIKIFIYFEIWLHLDDSFNRPGVAEAVLPIPSSLID